jgi:hypothetical protein
MQNSARAHLIRRSIFATLALTLIFAELLLLSPSASVPTRIPLAAVHSQGDATGAASALNPGGIESVGATSWTPDWANLTQPSLIPGVRQAASMTFDPNEGSVVLFGGEGGRIFNDTWTYRSGGWASVPCAVAPSARYGAAMAFDAADGYVVLFGGTTSTPFGGPGALNDTWAFSAGTWTRITTQSSPSPRFGATMTYDVRDNAVVLFGGSSFPDTWEYRAGHWVNVTGGITPSPRFFVQMAYDAADGYVVMFEQGVYSEGLTWSFQAGSWTNRTASTQPPERSGGGMVFDLAIGSVVMFGGLNSVGAGYGGELNDTWVYRSATWTLEPAGLSPPARDGFATAYDSADNYLLIFSGERSYSVYQYISDQWAYGGVPVNVAERGIPSGTQWAVTLNGSRVTTVQTTIRLFEGPGTYALSPEVVSGWIWGMRYYPASRSVNLTVAFSPLNYTIAFSEEYWLGVSLLPIGSGTASPGTNWLSAGTTIDLVATASPGYQFKAWNGNYPTCYSGPTNPVRFYLYTPCNETAAFAVVPMLYGVTFTRSGLPDGTIWSVTLNGSILSSAGPTINFREPNGTLAFTVGKTGGYIPRPSNGTISVSGSSILQAVTFSKDPNSSPTGPGGKGGFLGIQISTWTLILAIPIGLILAGVVWSVLGKRRRSVPPRPVSNLPTKAP